jgi:hypothetical protein
MAQYEVCLSPEAGLFVMVRPAAAYRAPVDQDTGLIDMRVDQPLHNAYLRGRDRSSRAVPLLKICQGVVQILHDCFDVIQFVSDNRHAGLIKPGVAKQ